MKKRSVSKRLLAAVLSASMAMTPVTACIPVYAESNAAAVSDDGELTLYYSSWNEAYEALKSYCGIADASHYTEPQGDLINAFLDKWPDILYGATDEDEANSLLRKAKAEFDALPLDDEEAMEAHKVFMAERETVFNKKMAVMEAYIANVDYTGDSRFDYETAAREALGTILRASDYEVLNAGVEAFEACVSLLVEVPPALKAAQKAAKEELAAILANEYENIPNIENYYSRIDNCNNENEINAVIKDCIDYMAACINSDIAIYRNKKMTKSSDYCRTFEAELDVEKFSELKEYFRANMGTLQKATTKAEVDSAYSELLEMIDAKVANLTGADTPAPTEGLLYELIDKRDDDNNFIYDAAGNKVQVVQISGMSKAASQLVIPAEIDGYPVEVIGTGAFEEQAISEVVFPDTIIEIKLEAFKGCNLLTSVKLPKNLEKLGHDAFGSCVRLTEVWIPKSLEKCGYEYSGDHILEVTKGPFINCDNLKTVEFEEGTTVIANELFANCKGLEKIEIPDTVTEIESTAFLNCINLKEIIFTKEGKLNRIYSSAFKGCAGLTSIVLPDSVKRIGTYAFSECSSLKNVKLSKIEAIEGGAFYDCDNLENIVIPKTLTSVPESVTPDSASTKAQFVFSECDRLKNITFEDGLTEIADGLLYKCDKVESLVLPDSIKKIGSNAFYKCSALREIKLSAQLEEIETKAFEGCSALTDIKFPENLKKIGNYTFLDCINLKNADLAKLEDIGGGAFYNCDSLESIEIPRTLVKTSSAELGSISRLIFTECENLKNITFENGTTVIANGILNDCKYVEEIDLPTTVQSISSNAFSKCTNLEKITIRQEVTDIHEKAFDNVEGLVIYGFTGSYAEEYANTYGFAFVSIGEVRDKFGLEDVYRVAGTNRYETSLKTASALKEQLKIEKFSEVILANGRNFPDALAGSYLAGKLNAPILMANEKAQYSEPLRTFIKENLESGGTIYILGGTGAVPDSVVQGLEGFEIKRLAGATRYETNLMILEEAGVAKEPILICTGRGFADSLSASATGYPILLVGKSVTADQEAFMAAHKGNQFYIIGGESAVSADIEPIVKNYGKVKRIAGNSRYETSILVAETFFENPKTAVLASAKNFPDGLCGGPLAMSKNAPLILTATGKESTAVTYAKANGIRVGAVLGGDGLISDEATNSIFESITITEW